MITKITKSTTSACLGVLGRRWGDTLAPNVVRPKPRAACTMRIKGSQTWRRETQRAPKGYKKNKKKNGTTDGIETWANVSAALGQGVKPIVDSERPRRMTQRRGGRGSSNRSRNRRKSSAARCSQRRETWGDTITWPNKDRKKIEKRDLLKRSFDDI